MRPVDERIARLAFGQHGLVTVGQLRRLGVGGIDRAPASSRPPAPRPNRGVRRRASLAEPRSQVARRGDGVRRSTRSSAIDTRPTCGNCAAGIELDLAAINVSVPPARVAAGGPGSSPIGLHSGPVTASARSGAIPVTSLPEPSSTSPAGSRRRTLSAAIDQALTDRLVTAPGLHSALDRAGLIEWDEARFARCWQRRSAFETESPSRRSRGAAYFCCWFGAPPCHAGAERPAARTQGRRRLVAPNG